jgi:hypothetical protein
MHDDIDLANDWFHRRRHAPPTKAVIKRLPTEVLSLLHQALTRRLPTIGPWSEDELVVLHLVAWEYNERTSKEFWKK